jgi:pSer/pThr/pTyr-binding forkhead associated (FHA) protein
MVGGLAGILAWMIIEPTKPPTMGGPAWTSFELRLILTMAVFVGMSVGGLDGYTRGSRTHVLRGVGFGLIFGAIGALFGYSLGGQLSALIFGGVRQGLGPITVLSRVVALAPLGLFLGAAIGGSSLTKARTIQGAIGGAIGAATGAAVFDIVGSVLAPTALLMNGVTNGSTGEVGAIPRAIFATTMGAAIGLFIGLVERFSRRAWVRLQLGRNEGKEWSIDSAQTFIGRSEGAQIPLFGDMNVAPVHATIQKQGPQYILVDGGSPIGTYVNGQRISSVALFPGALIQIGGFRLEFMLKGQSVPYSPMSAPMVPMPGQMPQPAMATPMMPTPMVPNPMAAPMMPNQMAMTQAYPVSPAASMPTQAYASPPVGGGTVVAIDGPLTGQRFPIQGNLDFGRESGQVPMAYDTQASRRHAAIQPGPTSPVLTDLGSTNGTYVNGQRIQTAPLRPGDLFKVGSTTFRFEP